MRESDDNAQQRAYYFLRRSDHRYWWSLFIFFFDASVLNVCKLWKLLYPNSKLSHSEFQYQITKKLLTADAIRLILNPIVTKSTDDSMLCEWEHRDKRTYCTFCEEEAARLKRRQPMKEIWGNCIKRKRVAQTGWQCSRCGPCCRKEMCRQALHRSWNSWFSPFCYVWENYKKGLGQVFWLVRLRLLISTRPTEKGGPINDWDLRGEGKWFELRGEIRDFIFAFY